MSDFVIWFGGVMLTGLAIGALGFFAATVWMTWESRRDVNQLLRRVDKIEFDLRFPEKPR